MDRIARSTFPKAILFDMDGTITQPLLDFDAIRKDLDVKGPILEALRSLEGDPLRRAHAILDRHERAAAERSELNAGCTELLAWLAEHGCRTALITRNSRSSTRIVLEKHALRFDVILTREDEPAKPHPQPLHHALRVLTCDAHQAWMVGDGSHDIEAAAAAGVPSVWISHRLPRTFDAVPDVTISALQELLDLLRAIRNSPDAAGRVSSGTKDLS